MKKSTKIKKHKSTKNKVDENVIEQLKEVYGNKKAKEIMKKISQIKEKHPDVAFSFVFDIEGNLQAIPKGKKTDEN